MTHTIEATTGGLTTEPLAVEGYSLNAESRSIFHDTLDGGQGYSYVPPRPSSGTITLVYETRADAFDAYNLHYSSPSFIWTSTEVLEVSTTYAVDGSVTIEPDGAFWKVSVDIREVPA